ncbi:MAG: nucleoside deaminase [bacterium]|nr:nucleoside deaminase [bacterium]
MHHSTPAAPASDRDTTLMRQALAEAQVAGEAGEVPVGAVLVSHDGSVLGRGGNRTRRDGIVHAHAELVALAAAERAAGDFRLDESTMYVTLEPCLMCLGALLQARVTRIVFGAREPKFGALYSRFPLAEHPLVSRVHITEGVLAGESTELLSGFFRELRAR